MNFIFVIINNLDDADEEFLENALKMSETPQTICQEDDYCELASVSKCDDDFSIDLENITNIGTGHLLNVSFILKNVYPGERYSVLVTVYEIDPKTEKEYKRGRKFFTVTVPKTFFPCSNLKVDCVHFILPDDVAVEDFDYNGCDDREFEISISSHLSN